MRIDAAFIPVIVIDRLRLYPLPEGFEPSAVRIAPASHLTDGDLVVGCAETVTDESREACATELDAQRIWNGEFFRRTYAVDGHKVDADGWVTLRNDCLVWRSSAYVLYVPRDYR